MKSRFETSSVAEKSCSIQKLFNENISNQIVQSNIFISFISFKKRRPDEYPLTIPFPKAKNQILIFITDENALFLSYA